MSDKTFTDALIAARKKMREPHLTGNNPHFGSKFVPRDEALSVVMGPLMDAGLFLSQGVIGGRMVTALKWGNDGNYILGEYPVPEIADPQKYAAACTYASRISLMLAFGLAGEPDDDGNSAVEGERVEKAVQQAKAEVRQAAAPVQADASAGAYKVAFGKHKGLSIAEIAAEDIGWLKWLTTKAEPKDYNKTAIAKATAYLASLEVPAPTEGPLAEVFQMPAPDDPDCPF